MTELKKDWSVLCQKNDDTGQKKFLSFNSELKEAMSEAISKSGLSRGQVAGQLSELMGRDITLSALDNICSIAKSERFPQCDLVIGICLVTNSIKPFTVQAKYLPHVKVIQDIDAYKIELFESQQKVKTELQRQLMLKKKLGIMDNDSNPEVIQ